MSSPSSEARAEVRRGDATRSSARVEVRVRLPLAHFTLDVDVTSTARSLGVFGPSGAGKTSLVEALAGWRTPAAGRIRLGDTLLFDDQAGVSLAIERRGIGYVPQDALLFPHWTVGRNVRAGAPRGRGPASAAATPGSAAAGAAFASGPTSATTGAEARSRAAATSGGAHASGGDAALAREGHATTEALVARTAAILEITHLLERPCTQLSGGERQRVALARALVSRPSCLLLDEPLGSLDLPLRRRILPYLMRVRDEFGLPTVFVSHDATEVQALCEEVVVLEAGAVRAQGAPAEVLRYVRTGERAFENVLAGSVSAVRGGTALVRLDAGGDVQVPVPGLAVGARALFAVGSDEILVALDAPTRISARNVLPARVERIDTAPNGVARVDARLAGGSGAQLSASLTRASVDELGLASGQSVFLVFKTNSCRVLSTPLETAE